MVEKFAAKIEKERGEAAPATATAASSSSATAAATASDAESAAERLKTAGSCTTMSVRHTLGAVKKM